MKPKDVDVDEMTDTSEKVRDSVRELGYPCEAAKVTIQRKHYWILLKLEDRNVEFDLRAVESKIRTALPGRFVEMFAHKRGDKHIEIVVSRKT